ncbi:hypothetical protein FORC29_0176 [Escherichia coli]|nr:hypothetical protein FORC29_0176 [Escherichia coli]KDX07617.1 toxin Ldr, type I toxin-antitoxin system family protein [Escherichia coli 2-177-06_S4_C3]CCQ31099.2 hypothetical protein HUS2011_4221 [Escherichia coli]
MSLQHRRLYDARRAGHGFWHDLAAPVIAGILASMIVNWLNKRK